MDSEHVAPKRVDSRISPVAIDWWKAVCKETKRALVRGRPWRYGRRGGQGRQWLCSLGLFSLGLFVVSMQNGVGSGLLFHLNGFPDGTPLAAYKALLDRLQPE